MSQQIRRVIQYQAVATVLLALVSAVIGGFHAGLSAVLGGLVSVLAGLVYGFLISRTGKFGVGAAEKALIAMLRAEAAKIVVIVLLLWLVFSQYPDVVGAAFIGSFVVTTLIFSLAIFIRQK